MKRALVLAVSAALIGCTEQKTFVPDNSEVLNHQMQMQTGIQTALNDLFSLRLDGLEHRVTLLETRLLAVETSLVSLSSDVVALYGSVDLLVQADIDLRAELVATADELRAADSETRRRLSRKFRALSRALASEISDRGLAEQSLQDQINALNASFAQSEANQQVINQLLGFGIFMTNYKISMLDSRLRALSTEVASNGASVAAELSVIRSEIASTQSTLSSMGTQLDEIKASVVSVVYPCGESNETLLETGSGLIQIANIGSNKEITFQDTDTIPSHARCVGNGNGNSNPCSQLLSVAASTATQTTTISYFSLDSVKFSAVADGMYGPVSGWSCTFEVSGGSIVPIP